MLLVSGNEASRILRAMWISNVIWAFMKMMPRFIWRVALVSILAMVAEPAAMASVPCENLVMSDSRIEKLTIKAADNRAIPLEIFYPATPGKYPLVVFSHGAFASPGRYHALLKPIAAAGYVILAPRHLDSEEWEWMVKPSQAEVWDSREQDMILMLSQNAAISSKLAEAAIEVDYDHVAAMGHSYGALIAQIAGGTRPSTPSSLSGYQSVQAVVAFSPPGNTPGLIDKNGWSGMTIPSLTITGTTDILPGFVDDWQTHKHSFEFAPVGKRWLWFGEGVDHYFGGVIGREKPASEASRTLFGRALATTIAFLDQALGRTASCLLEPPSSSETLIRDGAEDE
jgi:dienelactone hydrolase